MSTSTESIPSSRFAALDISRRVLSLILNIRGRQDISSETVQQYMGGELWFDPDDKNSYGVTVKLTEVWYAGLDSMSPEKLGNKPDSLLFEFNDQTHNGADMSPICVPLETFKGPLISAGFTASQSRNRLNTHDIWYFLRDAISVSVSLRGKTTLKDAQTCVSRVIIEART